MSRDPAKSRPLSANVKRMMWMERASPRSSNVMNAERIWTENDYIYCHKQGQLFMEAAAMGFSMNAFVPLYMTSQIAGVIDYHFSTSNGADHTLTDLLKIPALLQNPRAIIESLYWIEEIIENSEETGNKSLLLAHAYDAEQKHTPKALLALPETENSSIDDLSYAYWLGYIYRCECILHDESSRMVYSAFPGEIMRGAYHKVVTSPMNQQNLSDCAKDICAELDRLLVEEIWPEQKHRKYL